ncbi:FecR family protein [Larkinella insperata]|uniref:FecR family protein n=1 Tax=Larkinella insperata TaxID=332158 RepID=A0ABW3Q1H3_9BACT
MNDYSAYTIEELVRDDYFRNSILNPDAESTAFWQSWLVDDPARRERYEKARILIITLHQRFQTHLSQEQVLGRVEQLVGQLDESEITPEKVKPLLSRYWWRVAAVLIACSGLLWFHSRDSLKSILRSNEISQVTYPIITKQNNTQRNQTLILSDSSVVTLFPGSLLSFPERFTGASRQVTLRGDAFFEVTPRSRPFLVYAGETVTRVLGTRFRVTALPKEDLVKVSVKSGKVSVHPSSEFNRPKPAATQSASGLVITAHQQVVFNRTSHRLEKAPLTDLAIVAQNTDFREQVFVDTPVTEVFRELESLYGVDIKFDEKVLAHCRVITSFRRETLLERINSICQAIEATYEPDRGGIVISGSGCPVVSPEE